MSRFGADRDFQASVDGWIKEAARSRPDFAELLRVLPAVDPLVALAALDRAAAKGEDDAATAAEIAAAARAAAPTWQATIERPVPHPLEYYWRSDAETIERLCGRLKVVERGATIGYLGAPNVCAAARTRLPGRRHVLVDRAARDGGQEHQALDTVQVDVFVDEVPDLRADAVVTDPPWYPEHIRGFLWAAQRLANPGGRIIIGLPPDGTRPGIREQRSDLLAWASSMGLCLEEYLAGELRYITPPFELASHRAAAVGGIPIDWRTGDLGIFRVLEKMAAPRPYPPTDEDIWTPVVVHEIPIWFRDRPVTSAPVRDHLWRSVVPGDVLRTVSRRDPGRAHIDVWTSLNRVYASTHPNLIAALARLQGADGSARYAVAEETLARPISGREQSAIDHALSHLERIVAEERVMHGLDDR